MRLQVDADAGGVLEQLPRFCVRDDAARSASLFRVHPAIDATHVTTSHPGNDIGAADLGDDAFRWLQIVHEVDNYDNRNLSSSAICDLRDFNLCGIRNNLGMQADEKALRAWLANQFKSAGRGSKKAVAEILKIRPDAVSRMISAAGEMRRVTALELEKIAAYFGVPVPSFTAKRGLRAPAPRRLATNVPRVSWTTAGRFAESVPTSAVEETIPIPDLAPGDYIALRVQGDSMDRVSPENSIIVVNRRERTLQRGKPYVFGLRGETTYKIWESDPPRLEPFSTNPSNRPIFIDKKKKLFIVGRVRRTFMDL